MRSLFLSIGVAFFAVALSAACSGTHAAPPILGSDDGGAGGLPRTDAARNGDEGSVEAGVADASLSVDASHDATADAPLSPADAAADADAAPAPGDCHATGTPPSSCAPSHVTCTGVVVKPAASRWQSKCSLYQINGFYDACIAGAKEACASFKLDGANAACLGCMISQEGDSTWGPLVIAKNGIVTVNVGGCSHDPKGTGGCAYQQATLESCLRAACENTCGGDPADPSAEERFRACQEAARKDPESCQPYVAGECRGQVCGWGETFAGDFYNVVSDFCLDSLACHPETDPDHYFVPTWKPPAPLHQAKCTSAQVDAFFAACDNDLGGSDAACAAFRTDNPACDACIRTPRSDAAWGPLVLDSAASSYFVNETGCVTAALDDPQWTKSCESKLFARTQCEFGRCTLSGYYCTGLIAPFDPCAHSTDNSTCAPEVAAAKDCETSIRALGGEAAQCLGGSDLVTTAKTIVGLFCGP